MSIASSCYPTGLANVGQRTPEALGDLGATLIKEGISVTIVGIRDWL
ncbi:MAG: hypothetical protein R3E08_03870 [Thiotrichaceae bacterium]